MAPKPDAVTTGTPVAALLDNYSVEITCKDLPGFIDAAPRLRPGSPVSITYLPGEGQEARVGAAALVRRLGFVPVPHISARRLASVEELDSYLAALSREAGLDRCFVVAGDCEPRGPFHDALSVIQSGRLAVHGVKRVGISGYPEGHPDIATDLLWKAMADKHRTLLDFGHEPIITTQFAFDAESILNWITEVRSRGINSTLRLGVPGPATVQSLIRFAARCGVGASTKILRKYGVSITKLMTVAGPDRMLTELAESLSRIPHGDVRIHLYPFGGIGRSVDWATNFVSLADPA